MQAVFFVEKKVRKRMKIYDNVFKDVKHWKNSCILHRKGG